MYDRFLQGKIKASKSPVILINGARQVGKSTLVKQIFSETHEYFTLDDLNVLHLIKKNPQDFIKNLRGPVIIDEIQRCPEILLAIKCVVDEKREPQKFILTGSVNLTGLKGYIDSLAGRMSTFTLWPLSQEEISKKRTNWIDSLFNGENIILTKKTFDLSLLKTGGYPICVIENSEAYRKEWLKSYVQQIIEKDVRDIAHIEGITDLPNIAKLLSSRVGSLVNLSELSRSLQIPNSTLKRYIDLLQMTFLYTPLKPWYKNLGKRLTKSEKIYIVDTALIMILSGGNCDIDPSFQGHVFENFVYLELLKQFSYAFNDAKIFHYRTTTGKEIDFIIETDDGELIAIEVKSHSQINIKDAQTIKEFNEKNNIKIGIILYKGDKIIPIDHNIFFVPIHVLWS